jgi:hypothetical protein
VIQFIAKIASFALVRHFYFQTLFYLFMEMLSFQEEGVLAGLMTNQDLKR